MLWVLIASTLAMPLMSTDNVNLQASLAQLLCFRHLSESRFLLGALNRRSKFANICHDLIQNHLS